MRRILVCLLVLFSSNVQARLYHKRLRNRSTEKVQTVQVTERKRSYGRRTKVNTMQLRVDGIECDLCAQTVVDIIAKHGGQDVQVKDIANDYERCYVEFVWAEKNRNVAIADAKKELEKEGFEFLSLNGSFLGTLKEDKEQLTLTLDKGLSIAKINQDKASRIKRDRLVAINGSLSVVDDQYNFELI